MARLFEESGLKRLADQVGSSNRSALQAAGAALYDISDDTSSRPTHTQQPSATSSGSFQKLETPQHSVQFMEADPRVHGSSGQIVVEVWLPEVERAADADVQIGGAVLKLHVLGKYRLQVSCLVNMQDCC